MKLGPSIGIIWQSFLKTPLPNLGGKEIWATFPSIPGKLILGGLISPETKALFLSSKKSLLSRKVLISFKNLLFKKVPGLGYSQFHRVFFFHLSLKKGG